MPEQPKKILHVVSALYLGGTERQTTQLSIAQKNTNEWEPSVCCVRKRAGRFLPVLEKNGISVYECRLDTSSLITFPFRFAKLLRQLSPVIVHSHVDSSIPWQIIGCLLGGVKHIIFTKHGGQEFWKDSFWARLRTRLYYWLSRPFISRYTILSFHARSTFSAMLKSREDRFDVIYTPVDTTLFKPRPEMRSRAREVLGVNENNYIVGTVARLSKPKGHTYLIEAAKEITTHDHSIRFVLVGGGVLQSQLEQIVREKGLADFFVFAGGRTDVHELYPAFDCMVLPSLWEGFPNAVIEAMASGVPVVATTVGGISEAIDGGSCGILVPPGDATSLARAILDIKSDPDKAVLLAEKARQRAVQSFGLEKIAQHYEKLYRSVLEDLQ